MDVIERVEALADRYTTSVCAAVGKGIDWAADRALLTDWADATRAALRATRGDLFYQARYRAMQNECRVFLECNAEAA